MWKFDNQYRDNEKSTIVGCDEVGRGCIAGPVVAACVMLPNNYQNLEIKDSKKLSKKQITSLYHEIIENALEWKVSFIDPQIIDQINILEASKMAIKNSLEQFKTTIDLALIDYLKIDTNIKQKNIIKGDSKSLSIAAASIIAKYSRDLYMQEIAKDFPNYDWENNVGYPTIKHKNAINKFGITKHHRKTFKPIKDLL